MLSVLATTEAGAQETGSAANDRVGLNMEACPDVSAESVRHFLGIEIGDLLLGEQQYSTATSLRLTIQCAGNVAWVEASGEGGAAPVDRTLRLDAFPGDAAARALTLAGLELLAARSPAVRARMEAKPEPLAPLPPAPALESSRPSRPILHIGAAGTWRSFWTGRGLSTWGGQAQLGWLSDRWHLLADLEVGGASRDVQLGRASAFLFSGAVALGMVSAVGNRAFTLALGGRLGMARLAGSAADPTTVMSSAVVRPWGGPMVTLGFIGRLRPLAVVVTAEAGRSLFTAEAQADSTTVLAVGGTWVAISVGIAVVP